MDNLADFNEWVQIRLGEDVPELAADPDEEWERMRRVAEDAYRELSGLMTAQEIADTYDIHRQTVHKAIRRGYLPARQSGSTWLIRRADAEARWGKRAS